MTALIVLAMVASVLLVIVVLAQNAKGGGLSSQFAGGGASNFIGVKKTADILEKLTWGFAIALMVFSLGVNLVHKSTAGTDEVLDKVKTEKVGEQPAAVPSLESAPSDSTK